MDYLSLEFSRQEYWSGLQFPSPGDLPNPGIEPNSPNLLEAPLEPPNVLLISGDLGAPQLILMNSQSWKTLLWRLKQQQILGGRLAASLVGQKKCGGYRIVGLLAFEPLHCWWRGSLSSVPLTNPSTSQILISKREKLTWKSTPLPRSLRKLRSQGSHHPENWRDEKIQRITIYQKLKSRAGTSSGGNIANVSDRLEAQSGLINNNSICRTEKKKKTQIYRTVF